MERDKYIRNINNSLNLIRFDQDLISMSRLPNIKINGVFYLELLLLCQGLDIFDLGQYMDFYDVTFITLYKLHFLKIIKVDLGRVPWSTYVICRLTPLGSKFIKNHTKLPSESKNAFRSSDLYNLIDLNNLKRSKFNSEFVKYDFDTMASDFINTYAFTYLNHHQCSLWFSDIFYFLYQHQKFYVKSLHGRHPIDDVSTFVVNWMFSPSLIVN